MENNDAKQQKIADKLTKKKMNSIDNIQVTHVALVKEKDAPKHCKIQDEKTEDTAADDS